MKKKLTVLCLLFMGLLVNPTFAEDSFEKDMDGVAKTTEHQADELANSKI
jgi:hypothetical protein